MNFIRNPKTIAHYTTNILWWENAKNGWDKRLRNSPNDKMTIAGHKSIHYIADQEIAKLRAKRSSLVGKAKSLKTV